MTLSVFFGVVARTVVQRRGLWLASFLALSLALAWAGSRVSFRLDAADFLPEESFAQDSLLHDVLHELSSTTRLAVFLEADGELDPAQVEPIFAHLTTRLVELQGIRRIHARLSPTEAHFVEDFLPRNVLLYLSPAALRAVSRRLATEHIEAALLEESVDSIYPGLRPRRQKDPLGLVGFAAATLQRWQGVSLVNLVDGFFALPGRKAFFFILESEIALDDIESARSLVRSIERILADAAADDSIGPLLEGRQLHLVGRLASSVAAYDTLYGDVVRIGIAAAIVMTLLLTLFFRSALAPPVLLTPVALGLLAAAAGAIPLFGSVSLIAWVFIGLMIGLGVDFGIHVGVHYWVYGNAAAGRSTALASALTRPGRGVLLSGVTSAAAFLAILAIPYPGMRQVAWLTAFGVLAILASSFTVLPLLLSLTASTARSKSAWSRWIALFESSCRVRPSLALTAWGLLVVVGAVTLPSLRLEPHPWKLNVRGIPQSAHFNRLSRLMGSAFTPVLVVSRGETTEQAIERDREAVTRLQSVALRAGVATIQSLARWLPNPDDQRANIELVHGNPQLFSPERFRRDFEATVGLMENPSPYLTEEYLPQVARSLNPRLQEVTLDDLRALGLGAVIDRHLLRRSGEQVAVSYVFLRRFAWAEGTISNFLEVTRAAGLEDLAGVTLAGEVLRVTDSRVIRRAVASALMIAALLVGGILWLRFRRLAVVGLCLAPLVCGLSAAVIVMRFLGIELNLLSMAIAPILVGIGVDDGIHMVERLRAGQDLGTALRETGSSVTMTTLTTVGAFACLALATFTGIRELGLVGAVALLVCLFASLHLIPLGWKLLGPVNPATPSPSHPSAGRPDGIAKRLGIQGDSA